MARDSGHRPNRAPADTNALKGKIAEWGLVREAMLARKMRTNPPLKLSNGGKREGTEMHIRPIVALAAVSMQIHSVAASPTPASTVSQEERYPAKEFPTLIPDKPLYELEKAMLKWPGDPGPYWSLDGAKMKGYVNEVVAISQRSKARGDKLWGRIIGTRADKETEQWLMEKLSRAGVSNVRAEPIKLDPQWFPDWDLTLHVGGKDIKLETAQAFAGETVPGGVELEPVWVGLGNPIDFVGKDVRGKAVFVYAIPYPGIWRHSAGINKAVERATELGAAAVVMVIGLPGNVRTQRGHTRAGKIPVMSLGNNDGNALREAIENAPPGSVRVKVRLEGQENPGMTTSNVWGELPGVTDEKIIILAHRDGYFDGAGDNASGLASMVGLAEYFAKIPKEKRRRTIQFVGTPGHHGTVGILGGEQLLAKRETALKDVALIINLEHTAAIQTYTYGFGPDGGPMIRRSNTNQAFWWYAGGSKKFTDIVLNAFAKFGIATYENPDRWAQGEMMTIYKNGASVQIIEANMLYHSDQETAETIPANGLEQSARAFAKIIDDSNGLNRDDLVEAGR